MNVHIYSLWKNSVCMVNQMFTISGTSPRFLSHSNDLELIGLKKVDSRQENSQISY